tara:strand:+ start:370 stop:642 length:273 start_codon:yes stop_codon:yes gene_type:complete
MRKLPLSIKSSFSEISKTPIDNHGEWFIQVSKCNLDPQLFISTLYSDRELCSWDAVFYSNEKEALNCSQYRHSDNINELRKNHWCCDYTL